MGWDLMFNSVWVKEDSRRDYFHLGLDRPWTMWVAEKMLLVAGTGVTPWRADVLILWRKGLDLCSMGKDG